MPKPMLPKTLSARWDGYRSAHRRFLLASVSGVALLTQVAAAEALPIGPRSGTSSSAPTIASDAATAAAQQAAAVAKQSQNAMLRATQAMQAAQNAARAAAANVPTSVTDGLSPGGLVVDPRVTAGTDPTLWVNAGAPTQSTSNGQTTVNIQQTAQRAIMTWQQFNVGRNTTLNFDQSGGNSANGNSWIALNRIDATGSPSQILGSIKAQGTVLLINPNGIIFNGTSQINVHTLIASSMDINSNSQTNVGVFSKTLGYGQISVDGILQTTASGAAVLAPPNEDSSNAAFLSGGLYVNSAMSNGGGSLILSAASLPNQGIIVQPGASIVTDVSGFDNGGYVALIGPSVYNGGAISTPAGQVILAAGQNIWLTEPSNGGSGTAYGVSTLGFGLALFASPGVSNPAPALTTNDVNGFLSATRGNVTLAGDTVNQSGVVSVTTSITRAGSIDITANTLLNFGANSLTTIQPDDNGETIPLNSVSTFVPPSITISAANMDMKGSGGGAGALIWAPGATMTVATATAVGVNAISPTGRVLLESGSTIDLAGTDATASIDDYLYTFKVTANDVADSPLARNLIGQTVTIDLRLSGTRTDGTTWVGSPLFSSSGAGYLGDIPRTNSQLLAKGGSLTFGGASSGFQPFNDVLQQSGSVIDIAGGTVTYAGGMVRNTTRLLGSDGRLYAIGSADPSLAYIGIVRGFTVNHPHWGVTETYADPLLMPSHYEPTYTDGISGGSLSIVAGSPILEGAILAAAQTSNRQSTLNEGDTGANGTQATPDQLPLGGALSISTIAAAGFSNQGGAGADAILLQSGSGDVLGADFTMTSQLILPTVNLVTSITSKGDITTSARVLVYSTDILSAAGFGSIAFSSASALSMAQGAVLTVQSGGSIKLGGITTLDGTLVAHAGRITLTGFTNGTFVDNAPPTSQLTIGPDALIDVSGLWVNDAGATGNAIQGRAYTNGGSVTIQTYAESSIVAGNTSSNNGHDYGRSTIADTTQSIVLAQGSLIDVSSGGYVQPNGGIQLANGLPIGTGGNLSLLTYVNNPGNSNAGWQDSVSAGNGVSTGGNVAPNGLNRPNQANVIMDGTIDAGGLAKGGTFSLQAPTIQIGGTAAVTAYTSGPRSGEIDLPSSFFANNGFSNYALTSTYGSVTVASGTTMLLQQGDYSLPAGALPASGAELRNFAALSLAPTGLRQPVNLTLTELPYGYGGTSDLSTDAGILVDNGAAIVGEPGASIALTAAGPVTVLGSIIAHGGSIALTNNGQPESLTAIAQGNNGAGTGQGVTQAPLDVWIGARAVLDVSGIFVPNPLISTYQTGSVLSGGSITLSGGIVVAMPGSSFDLAGTSATIELPNPVRSSLTRPAGVIAQPVWSDGGALTLLNVTPPPASLPGYYQADYFDGTVDASGGAPLASGGSLTIGAQSGGKSAFGAIIIAQSGNVTSALKTAGLNGGAAPTTAAQLAAVLPNTNSYAYVTGDTLSHSGFDSVTLMATTIAFSGNVTVKVPNSLTLAGNITLLPTGKSDPTFTASSIGKTAVNVDAGYLLLVSNTSFNPSLSDGTLNLNATAQIDLAGYDSVSNAANVNLTSGGDIRLLSDTDSRFFTGVFGSSYFLFMQQLADLNLSQSIVQSPGMLAIPDNLTLTAREVYPTTDSAFLLVSTGKGSGTGIVNTITIASNGQMPVAPVSVDGNILIDAQTIVQNGVLVAPLGNITLGLGAGQAIPSTWTQLAQFSDLPFNVPAAVVTRSVTLSPGSITSVSAAGLDLPYGTTINGTNWSSIDPEISAQGLFPSLTAPPSKSISLNGASVSTLAGALLDLSGGGDIYATEFVPGTGGSRNVLTGAASGQAVYALVPGYAAQVGATDTFYGQAVTAGASVTLPGGNGIPAGTYTLLPASYATLPGAYRVVVVSTNQTTGAVNHVMADGSVYMTGTLGNAITGARSSQTALLEIQSDAVWTKYSEIDIASGNSYFAKLAATNGTITPRLPIDAGQLVIGATSSLTLLATNRFSPAHGGRGGLVDITGTNLLILAPDQTESAAFVAAGYIVLNSDQISNLGAESIMIGGTRSQESDGSTLVTPTAASIVVATDAAHPLTAPDLLLVANPSALPLVPESAASSDTSGQVNYFVVDGNGDVAEIPVKAAGSVQIAVLPGSVIEAKGAVSSASSAVLHLGTAVTPLSPTFKGRPGNLSYNYSTNSYNTAPSGAYLLANNNPITTFYEQAFSGGGLAALLEVSNGPASTVQRTLPSLPATISVNFNGSTYTFTPPSLPSYGSIDIRASAVVGGGNALTLNGGNVTIANNAAISANNFAFTASSINFGNAPAGATGLTLSPALIAQLAGAQSVTLTSSSVFNSYDASGVSLGDPARPIGTLTFDGAGLYSQGGTTIISADDVILIDSQASPGAPPASGAGSLIVDATGGLTFGTGATILSGFSQVALNASQQIAFAGSGSVNAGSAAVTLAAPDVVVSAGSAQGLTTTGILRLQNGAGTMPIVATTDVGGALTLTGGSISDGGTITALGGELTLTATTGDIVLSPGASINAGGSHIVIVGASVDAAGGAVKLIANAGNVTIDNGASIDVSATGNGFAGSLTIQTASGGTATLNGALAGGAAFKDLGGNFALNAGKFSGELPFNSGFTGSFSVTLGQGDIVVPAGITLASGQVALVANGGSVIVDGTIDASGPTGGSIQLYGAGTGTAAAGTAGATGVTIGASAQLLAAYRPDSASDPNYAKSESTLVQNGGTITLGTTGTPDGTLNAIYGYENVDGSGAITVAPGAYFDISGGAGGPNISNSGGAVIVRAPILTNGNVNVSFGGNVVSTANGGPIGGGVVLDAFAVWSTKDAVSGPTFTDAGGTVGSGTHFDGIIDPAGWYNANGTQIAGSTANGDIFTPSGGVNSNHVTFYQTTLVNFVKNPFTIALTSATSNVVIGQGSKTFTTQTGLGLTSGQAVTMVDSANPANTMIGTVTSYDPRTGILIVSVNRTTGSGTPGGWNIAADNSAAIANDFAGASGASLGSTLHLRPEIDLINPSSTVNGGNITVASNWNLGAGTFTGPGGAYAPFYRTVSSLDAGEPGVLSLAAVNNVQINATISDGFYETSDPFFYENLPVAPVSFASAYALYQSRAQGFSSAYMPGAADIPAPPAVASFPASYNSVDVGVWYGAFYQYFGSGIVPGFNGLADFPSARYITIGASGAVFDNNPNDYSSYAAYLAAYNTSYVGANYIAGESSVTFRTPASSVNGTTQNLTNFDNAPTHYSSYTNYANAFYAYYKAMSSFMSSYYTAHPTQFTNLPSTALAPAPPPMFGTSYETSAATYFSDYDTVYAKNTYGGTGLYVNFLEFYYGTAVEPGAVAAGAKATQMFLLPLPYLPAISETPNPSVNVTPPAAGPGNTIANNPAANGTLIDYNTTTVANLMPAGLGGSQGSFSYNIVAGANFSSGAFAVNPDAVITSPSDSVTLNGHTAYANPNNNDSLGVGNQTIYIPTVVRTGTGSITIAAAGSFELLDTAAPGAVYTAGVATNSAAAPTLPTATSLSYLPTGLLTAPAWGTGGGAVTIIAGNDIVGIETPIDSTSKQTGVAGMPVGEFWSAWYYVSGPDGLSSTAAQNSTWINYGTFFQGVGALGGGNVTVKAGHDVDDLSVSLPETIQVVGASAKVPVNYYGGGDLVVQAGGNLYGSTFYVGRGTGTITVGGVVAADPLNPVTGTATTFPEVGVNGRPTGNSTALPLLLAVQDGFVTLNAAGSVTLGDVFDPTRIPFDTAKIGTRLAVLEAAMPAGVGAFFDSYGPNSGVALTGLNGDIVLSALKQPGAGATAEVTDSLFFKLPKNSGAWNFSSDGGDEGQVIAPATLEATAFAGNIFLDDSLNLIPSATGTISLIAGQSISTSVEQGSNAPYPYLLAMLDGNDLSLRSLLGAATPSSLPSALHAGDSTPVIIDAGDNITGSFTLIKPALVEAGNDIVNVNLIGQNNSSGDITSVIAGRDILARQITDSSGDIYNDSSTLLVYGPGSFLVQAGRNLGPFFTGDISNSGGTGIESIGDGSNAGGRVPLKTYLPVQGANIYTLFGVGPGIDYQAAIADYVDPASAGTRGIDYLSDIAAMLGEAPSQAWSTFQALPSARRNILIDRAYLDFLAQVGKDYNDASSPYFHQYARAYQTIATLFPASLGYTDNTPNGTNGTALTKSTGDLSMAHSLLETQTGGDIGVIGPGGNIFVGANATDQSNASQEGILTLQGGAILTYTDQSVLVYQSRIFTEQGGDINMFSANGDLNAGKGPKSSAAYPPLQLILDFDGYSRVNPSGLVTGAGIGALLTIPGQDPSLSNADLVAPRGTVDAGAAGIRVAGNLNIAALFVLNAFNIQVQGTTAGLPTVQGPPVLALSTASNATAATQQATAPSQSGNDRPSVIIVEVLGYGGGDGDKNQDLPNDGDPRKKNGPRSDAAPVYDPSGPVRILGVGSLTDQQKQSLSEAEKEKL